MILKSNLSLIHRHNCSLVRYVLPLLMVALLTGCFANYGKYKISRDVAGMFESLQVPDEYKYYYAGSDKDPDALMGLHRDYTLNNDLWKETDMNRDQMKKWIAEINLIGYSTTAHGRYILDPNGKTIGMYYSKWEGGPIKMESGNQVVIHLPDTDRNRQPILLP